MPTGNRLWERKYVDLEGYESARFVGNPAVSDAVVHAPIDGVVWSRVVRPMARCGGHISAMRRAVPLILLGGDNRYSVTDDDESLGPLAIV